MFAGEGRLLMRCVLVLGLAVAATGARAQDYEYILPELRDERSREVLVQLLRDTKEPSLLVGTSARETYRLLYIPSVDYSKVVVRVEDLGDLKRITLKRRCSTTQIPEEPCVSHSSSREISQSEWDTVLELIEESSFWETPGPDNRFGVTETADGKFILRGCFDGVWCVLEGRRGGTYHVVDRLCDPEELERVCDHLRQLVP